MFILDTNVVSELRKVASGRANDGVARWAKGQSAVQLFISVVTILELELGVLLKERQDRAQGAILRAWFTNHVLPSFDGRIFPVDVAVARHCAQLHVPDHKAERDALIAATAVVHGMTLVTRNTADFEDTGAAVLNPWSI